MGCVCVGIPETLNYKGCGTGLFQHLPKLVEEKYGFFVETEIFRQQLNFFENLNEWPINIILFSDFDWGAWWAWWRWEESKSLYFVCFGGMLGIALFAYWDIVKKKKDGGGNDDDDKDRKNIRRRRRFRHKETKEEILKAAKERAKAEREARRKAWQAKQYGLWRYNKRCRVHIDKNANTGDKSDFRKNN